MITQAGLFVAIYAIFFLVSRFSGGILESLLFFLLPLPLIIFVTNYGIKWATIPFVAVALIGFAINPISTIFYVLTANILGIFYGEMVRKNTSSKVLCLLSIIVSCIVEVLTSLVFADLLGYDINTEIKEIYVLILKVFHIYSENEIILNKLILATIPLFILVLGFIEGFVTHCFASIVLSKLKIRENDIWKIYKFKLPKWTLILYFISLLLHIGTLSFFYEESTTFLYIISWIFLEIYWILALIYLAKGYLFLSLLSAKKKWIRVVIIMVIIGMVLIPIPIIFIMSIIGVVSVFSDK